MARRRRQSGKNAARWSPVLFFAVLSALLFASDQPSLGLFVLLAMLVPYLALFAPLRCRASTQKGPRCRNVGVGIFIGCHQHRLDYLARILTRDRPVRPARPSRASTAPGARSGALPPVGPGVTVTRVAYDAAMLIIAAVSALAGVLALRNR